MRLDHSDLVYLFLKNQKVNDFLHFDVIFK